MIAAVSTIVWKRARNSPRASSNSTSPARARAVGVALGDGGADPAEIVGGASLEPGPDVADGITAAPIDPESLLDHGLGARLAVPAVVAIGLEPPGHDLEHHPHHRREVLAADVAPHPAEAGRHPLLFRRPVGRIHLDLGVGDAALIADQ
jgi:hypothetical protein